MVAPLLVFPEIDLGAARLFFDPIGHGFPFRSHPLGEFARKTVPVILFALAALVALAGLAAALRKRDVAGISPRMAAFVVASLALGPGLVVNTILKDHWGRARPSTIAEFTPPAQQASAFHYTLPLMPSDQCQDNCSFPSGHAALGFWTLSFALLAPPRRRRKAVTAALGFGLLMGLVRMAQGGHFLSDVAFSGIIVVGLTLWLHRTIVDRSMKNYS
ncbi:MAG: phosphatase PAP2 family protein [Magnetospirillum sp.]|nr:phosphatase PAP2 family protein [Magnetospirillum sp.]